MRGLVFAACAVSLVACNRGDKSSAPAVDNVPTGDFRPAGDADQTLARNAREALLAAARAACEGRPFDGEAPPELADFRKPVVVHAFREDGGHAGRVRVDGDAPVLEKVSGQVEALCRGKDAGDLYLHVLPVTYTLRLPNFGIVGIFDYRVFEPQVMGLAYEVGGKRVESDPIQQLLANHGPKSLRSALSKSVGLNPKRAPADNALTIEIYRVQHFGERYPDRAFGDFYRGFEVLRPEDVNTSVLTKRLKLIGEWYRHNVVDGQVTYRYHPTKRQYENADRTMVRSTMSTWVLNRLARFLADDELSAKGMEVIRFYFERYFDMERSLEAGRILASTTPLANGNLVRDRYTVASFIAAALLERADWKDHAKQIELLMTYAMGFKRADGVMWTPFGQSQFFMPGQLLLGVAYAYGATKEARYKAFFDEVFDTYAPILHGMMALGHERYAPYAPAWYTQPAAAMYALSGERKYLDLVFAINDRVRLHYEMNAAHQVHPDWDGILTPKPIGWGNNSITAAALESLADAAILAKKVGDTERQAAYGAVVRRTVTYLLRLQFTPANSYFVKDREKVVGGFKTDLVDHRVWMDNVWHLTSAFIKINKAGLLD